MYNTSEAYKTAIQDLRRQTKISGKITLTDETEIILNDDILRFSTLDINNKCVNNQSYDLGACYLGEIKLSIFNENINRYKLLDGTIEMKFSLKLPNETYEDVPLGVYKIAEANRTDSVITITGYDNMIKFDKALVPFSTTGTPFELLQMICLDCEMELENTEEEILELSAKFDDESAIPLEMTANAAYTTYRGLLSDIAKALGGFATISRNGKLWIRKLKTDDGAILYDNQINSREITDYDCKYTGIFCKIGDTIYYAGEDGNYLEVKDNLLNTGLGAEKQDLVDNIWAQIQDNIYTPFKVEYVGDPSLDIGDKIRLRTKDNEEITSIIFSNDWKYNGTQRLEASGDNPYLSTAKTATQRQIDDLYNKVAEGGGGTSGGGYAAYRYHGVTYHKIGYGDINKEKIIDLGVSSRREVNTTLVGQVEIYANEKCKVYFEYYSEDLKVNLWTPSDELHKGLNLINLYCVLPIVTTSDLNYMKVYIGVTPLSETPEFEFPITIDVNAIDCVVFGDLNEEIIERTDYKRIEETVGLLLLPQLQLSELTDSVETELT